MWEWFIPPMVIWWFPEIGYPNWTVYSLYWKNLLMTDDLGVPPFQETSIWGKVYGIVLPTWKLHGEFPGNLWLQSWGFRPQKDRFQYGFQGWLTAFWTNHIPSGFCEQSYGTSLNAMRKGKTTISMATFNSYGSQYQRVSRFPPFWVGPKPLRWP